MKKIASFLAVLNVFVFVPSFVLASQPTVIDPIGTNIVDGNGTVYMIATENGQTVRRPYTSAGAFLSYGFNSFNRLSKNYYGFTYPVGSFIPPQDGKIFCSDRGSDKGTCYLITNGQKAGFVSEAVFKGLGYSFDRAIYGDASFLPKASNIESASELHRQGTLLNLNNVIYYVQQNPFTGGVPALEGFKDLAAFDSWGYSLGNAIVANSADKNSVVLTEEIQARTQGELVPARPTAFPPPVTTLNPVQIFSLNPFKGPVGSQVTITGSGFTSKGNSVSFKDFAPVASSLSSIDGKTLQFTVPSALFPNCASGMACPQFVLTVSPGDYPITVTNANGVSNSVNFNVIADAFSSCMPSDTSLDSVVSIDLGGSNKVTVLQKLISLGALCKNGQLVDSVGKAIKFFNEVGCWGNPPANYQQILGDADSNLKNLQAQYTVIVLTCNPNGVMIQ